MIKLIYQIVQKKYLSTKPKYKSKYYNTGYPNDGYGVCSDVVVFALKDAGYDLQSLVNEHILANKDLFRLQCTKFNHRY